MFSCDLKFIHTPFNLNLVKIKYIHHLKRRTKFP